MKSLHLPPVAASLLFVPLLASAQLLDADADGLADSVETDTGVYISPANTGTSPANSDTDRDGFSDGAEVLRFLTSPVVPTDEPFYTLVEDARNPDEDLAGVDSQNDGRGYVGQDFGMAVTEVTNLMYARFLNAVAQRDDLYGLYTLNMGIYGGITRSGPSKGPYTYTVRAGWEGRPVAFVTVFDAMRYINWLHNGKPTTQVQNEATTEDGAYNLRGTNSRNIARRKLGAKYFLPDEHEWHKAAYFDPDPGAGLPADFYWPYADRSFSGPGGKFGVTFGTDLAVSGTSAGSSYYGTYDQDGNAWEWTESGIPATGSGESRFAALGGISGFGPDGWARNPLASFAPIEAKANLGFRVACSVADSPPPQETVPLMVAIGSPGNLADEEFGRQTQSKSIGSVGRPFQMGAYEVTNLDYADFLNARAKKDSFYRLYDARMGSDAANGGIRREGLDGNYTYFVKRGFEKKPVVYVSIYSAMRYCNWLHNGGRTNGETEDTEWGAYRLLGTIPPDTGKLTRNSGARYFLPNANEFYKAAYFDLSPAADSTFDYWKFATRSDSFDTNNNSANLADVDFSKKASYFGTYGQSGNVGFDRNPTSGPNTPADEPTAGNTGELLEGAGNTDDESATRTFRIAAAPGMDWLHPAGDKDGDGMPNGWEVFNRQVVVGGVVVRDGVNVNVKDANDDADRDGLINLREFQRGTDPSRRDTDGDGLSDFLEVDTHRTNPLKSDTDGDGMSDAVEIANSRNPLVFDQDTVPLMVTVGAPGNLDDEEFAREYFDQALGKVNYSFQMGAYEITNLEYVRFLNLKARTDSFFRLYDARMGSAANGGILRTGENGSYSYRVKPGFAKKPVVFLSIFSAMRYCNWLHNGGRANSDMEKGAYALMGSNPTNATQPPRSVGARYYLPNAAEFYKAGYYDAPYKGGVLDPKAAGTFGYWKFATRSDSFDTKHNSADFADVDFSNKASYFGTYGQSGNVGFDPAPEDNAAAREPKADNTGELIEEARNTDDESATRTFRIAAAAGVPSLHPLGDKDGDGMRNGWEVLNSLDINLNDSGLDPDRDGLTNLQEYRAGTDPRKADTDGDDMPDAWEVQNNLNPKENDTLQDLDGDGLNNLREFQLRTHPRKADTDGDGMPDGWEVYYGRNPVSAADRDTDNDGRPDAAETAGGTDPLTFNTPSAAPALTTVGSPKNAGDPKFEGAGAVPKAYRIGTYEVTNEDYARFLNAVAKVSDPNNLYDTRMSFTSQDDPGDPWDLRGSGGIVRSGAAGAYLYTVKNGFARKPVNFVSYDSALRYCNWLHNGATPLSSTEKGAYDMKQASLAGPAKTRAGAYARFWLPNRDEWYKAAAYDVSSGPRYWQFAVRSDNATTSQVAVRPFTELVDVDKVIGGRSSVFPAPASYFGTFGQSGNAAEWVETTDPSQPIARGGSILSTSGWQYANVGDGVKTTSSCQPLNGGGGRYDIGFRIAAIAPVTLPAPKTIPAP